MAGVKPFFVTGDKLKIVLNGKTIAFATDLMCSVQIGHQTPHVLGMYEGVSVEPLSYHVSGSFSIFRYVHNAVANIGGKPPAGVSPTDAGNGVGNWGSVWGGGILGNVLSTVGNPLNSGSDGRANEALDPSTYSQGTTFDILVYQHNPNGDPLGVLRIRSARITKADFSVNKKSPAQDRFEFVALYMDGDAFQANPSGGGQQNT
ncbi:unnamed protein product [Sphagnum balticum]